MIQFNTFSKSQPLFDYLKKKREDRRFSQSIELSATFFLISFFLIFAIKPTAFTISALIGEIKAKKALSRHQMRPRINSIIQAQENFALVQQDYHVIESSLPASPRYNQAVTQILVAGQQNQITFPKITFSIKQKESQKQQTKTDPNIKDYGVAINSQTQFASTLSFLSHILNNRRLIDIDKISFARNQEDQPSSQVSVNFSAILPYWQEKNEKN